MLRRLLTRKTSTTRGYPDTGEGSNAGKSHRECKEGNVATWRTEIPKFPRKIRCESDKKVRKKSCMHYPTKSCGRDDHLANDDKCRAKGAECRKCKKIGHCAKYCRLSGAEKEERKVKAVQQTCQDTDENRHEYFASKEGGIDFKIDVEINGKPIEMIIDTGCARTLLPRRWFIDNIDSPLKQTNAKFSAFGGRELNCP